MAFKIYYGRSATGTIGTRAGIARTSRSAGKSYRAETLSLDHAVGIALGIALGIGERAATQYLIRIQGTYFFLMEGKFLEICNFLFHSLLFLYSKNKK